MPAIIPLGGRGDERLSPGRQRSPFRPSCAKRSHGDDSGARGYRGPSALPDDSLSHCVDGKVAWCVGFGELEAAIMDCLWSTDRAMSVLDVFGCAASITGPGVPS